MNYRIKSAVAFFFLFFLHGTFKRKTKLSHIAYNVLQLSAVCVGLWVGNCAKVLLCTSLFFSFLRWLSIIYAI